MMTRQSWTTLVLGALAGAGLGAGALALVRRPCEGCSARSTPPDRALSIAGADVASDEAFADPRADDRGTRRALETMAREGPADGRWRYRDPRRSLDQVMTRDPGEPVVLHLQASGGGGPRNVEVRTLPRDLIEHALFGSLNRFLANYRPCGDGAEGTTPEGVVAVRWCNVRGEAGPSRTVRVEVATGRVVHIEDHAGDGHLIRSLEFSPVAIDEIVPPVPGAAARAKAAMPALTNRTVPTFEDFVTKVDLPIYEPAELPAGYGRTEWGFDRRAFGQRDELRLAWIGYDEGVLQMNLFIAPPADMARLEELARRSAVKGAVASAPAPAAGCASMPEDTPEETLEGAGEVTVRVRSDGCRIVLRRDDLPGVAVALVGSASTPREVYIRAIRNLVRVESSKK